MKPVTLVIRVTNRARYESVHGYMLTRCNKKYNIQNVRHSSCNSTVWEDEDKHTYTTKDILHLAKHKCDPRIIDVLTSDVYLLELYRLILSRDIEKVEGMESRL